MRPVDLMVDLDLAVRHRRSVTRVRARHLLSGRSVTLVTAGPEVSVRIVDARDWRSELTCLCPLVVPADAPIPPRSDRELPWDLVVGTGAALATRRQDLYADLLARADDSVRDQLGPLHLATVGRLRAVGTGPGRRRIGWVAWLLYADGWRALTPCTVAGEGVPRPMVRLEPRQPDDLAHDVARWAAGAVR